MEGRTVKSGLDKATEDRLYGQLVKLGDMMGDGLHHEPGGKWISRDYKKVAKALGILEETPLQKEMKAQRRSRIDEQMGQRVKDVKCRKCTGDLTQTRKGSKRAQCGGCGTKWQLLK